MRGEGITTQPFVAGDGSVLLWNGEIFDGLEVAPHENDGQKLFDRIQSVGSPGFLSAIRDVEGPYAIVYYDAPARRVSFARDPLGRRSLLIHRPSSQNPAFTLCSCSPGANSALQEWEEVSCDAVHSFELAEEPDFISSSLPTFTSHSRLHPSLATSPQDLLYPFDRLNTAMPTPSDLTPSSPLSPSDPLVTPALSSLIQSFLRELERSLRARVSTVPAVPPSPAARIAVLFSGGLDCSVVALVADRVLPEGEAIDLINVAFENPRKIAAAKGGNGTGKGEGKKGKKQKDGKGKRKGEAMEELVELEEAVPSSNDTVPPEPSTLATAAPALASPSNSLPPPPHPLSRKSSIYDVPDRLTARSSWSELKQLRPNRRWNLVEVDVPYQEMLEHRQEVIDLMKPQNTVMDLSISIAFWFAARGKGHLSQHGSPAPSSAADASSSPSASEPSPPAPTPYHSQARVLLSGLGADELLGGYARHRRAFYQPFAPSSPSPPSALPPSPPQPLSAPSCSPFAPSFPKVQHNWPALLSELQLDLTRLPTRNLGRDDRVLSSHSKEARYPFLAGHVVSFLSSLPVWVKCDPRFEEGTGDKMLLRLAAREMGLREAAGLRKRAIHFGAQTAKMEVEARGAKGTDVLL
ncbi:hypothetical protein JCM8547_005625 [Rhodosporidiobolus lusitaniae]